uniref:Metalloendopeptidase n=1 Tax=Romanomermis culicivorax TaxID=13658 RepID=A0A915KWW9_ROMCU
EQGYSPVREQSLVNLSLEYWRNFTCLNFEYRDDEYFQHRIIFRKSALECESRIGRIPIPEVQFIELADGCFRMFGGIVHEIGHVLGLCHEQSRPDRDDHVEIMFGNMQQEGHSSFEIRKSPGFSTLGLPYDFGSIMHYDSHSFGIRPFIFPPEQTIRARKPAYQLTMGNSQQISFYDMKAVNMLYCSGMHDHVKDDKG